MHFSRPFSRLDIMLDLLLPCFRRIGDCSGRIGAEMGPRVPLQAHNIFLPGGFISQETHLPPQFNQGSYFRNIAVPHKHISRASQFAISCKSRFLKRPASI